MKTEADYFNVAPYKAPEIVSAGPWFNGEPLTLEGLKGKVVLVDFWTYSCINCIRSLPYLQAWYDAYKDSGFVIIGVHAPEFEFEKVPANVERAIKDRKLTYPIVQDNDMKTWNNFSNHYWPAHYLIDATGKVRREHFGEGEYDETEKAIRALLAEAGGEVAGDMTIQSGGRPLFDTNQTPETYLGYERGANFANAGEFAPDKASDYTLAEDLGPNEWSLGGNWQISAMESTAQTDDSVLRIKFSAKEVYLVMDGPKDATVTLKLNGKAVTHTLNGGADVGDAGRIVLDGARLYRLVNLPVFTKYSVLDISLPKGASVNAFTFGS